MSVRRKRNFLDLRLPAGPGSGESKPVPRRVAPIGLPVPRRFAPPAPAPHEDRPTDRRHAVQLDVTPQFTTSLLSSTPAVFYANTENESVELKKSKDFTILQELGRGNSGITSVKKVRHVATGKIMAKKVVLVGRVLGNQRRMIVRELQTIARCDSPSIVSSYHVYLAEPNICIWMEFMDKGSFDAIYKRIGPIDPKVVGKVAVAVLEGQRYLYDEHRIIHRDIRPSNILCNSQGDIKLCDFGLSADLINSMANTFIGTPIYMSVRRLYFLCWYLTYEQPERIQGATHTLKSDIWSLGMTLIELILGQFPSFDSDNNSDSEREAERTSAADHRASLAIPTSTSPEAKQRLRRHSEGVSSTTISIIQLMHQIVNEPAPRLPSGQFGSDAEDFVDMCLEKDVERRMGLAALFEMPWIKGSRHNGVDVAAWTTTF
ncbi:kinase-like domain-containing protein [Mycena amicta]|nr:kinase-like domain-containing protein [Mycena amicta]